MYYLHFFPLLAGFLQIQMNSASKSKKKWLGSLPLGLTKACVFVGISSAETHYSKIRSCHSKQQWVALRQKATMMLSNLLSGRSQLFFATSISHYKFTTFCHIHESFGASLSQYPACSRGKKTTGSLLWPATSVTSLQNRFCCLSFFPRDICKQWICDAKMEVRSSDKLVRASLANLQREQGEKPSLSPIPIAKFALPTFHLISGSNELVLKYVI